MPRLATGDKIKKLVLPAIDGSVFDLSAYEGKRYMLSFYRFATCPLCNLRVHELVRRRAELPAEFGLVAVFDASLEELTRHATRHGADFPILADSDNTSYRQFGVERSAWRTAAGFVRRFPQIAYGVLVKGYFPGIPGGNITTMPLDILVNDDGTVHTAYYGRDEGDHLPMKSMFEFALGAQRPDGQV